MSDDQSPIIRTQDEIDNWRTRTLIIGGIAGLLVGIGAAYVYIREADEIGADPAISTGDMMKIGISLISLIGSIGGLGKSQAED